MAEKVRCAKCGKEVFNFPDNIATIGGKIYCRFCAEDIGYSSDAEEGRVDANKMTELLNDMRLDGWHLVTAYSNELGKNALSMGGFGINSVVDENIFLFERWVKV